MKSVLVVDDEQALVLALDLALKSAGYKVLCAFNGEDALLIAKDAKPDVILLDIMMPGMGGLETLEVLKAHPDLSRTPVIIMSGARPLGGNSDKKWDGFLSKPFLTEELLEVIESYTDKKL